MPEVIESEIPVEESKIVLQTKFGEIDSIVEGRIVWYRNEPDYLSFSTLDITPEGAKCRFEFEPVPHDKDGRLYTLTIPNKKSVKVEHTVRVTVTGGSVAVLEEARKNVRAPVGACFYFEPDYPDTSLTVLDENTERRVVFTWTENV